MDTVKLSDTGISGPVPAPKYDRDWLVNYLNSPDCRNIVVLTGAGISVAAGIPDFRSPTTGLYANLEKYNLSHPEDIFNIRYFRDHPQPFYTLAKELIPEQIIPTTVHLFIRLLDQKRMLLRTITQNIDALELEAGIPEEKVVFAHGSFATAHCIRCHAVFPTDVLKESLKTGTVTYCQDSACKGLVKPDIVFFGEALPHDFGRASKKDLPNASLLMVLGTSLKVLPFAALPSLVGRQVPRVLINRELVTMMVPPLNHEERYWGRNIQLRSQPPINRDVFLEGDCQDTIAQLITDLGWEEDLELLKLQLSEGKILIPI